MKKVILVVDIVIFFTMTNCSKNPFKYPVTRKSDTFDVYFGKKIQDPYRWLENPNSEETKKWVAEENKLTFDYLDKIPFREKIIKRLFQTYNYPRMTSPLKKAGKYFFLKNNGLQNQDILYYQESLKDTPKILLDPNQFDKEGKISLGEYSISKNGRYLAYAVSQGGSDWRKIYIKNIETGEIMPDSLMWVKFSTIAWYKDGFFYSRYPEPNTNENLTDTNKNHQICYHRIHSSQKDDLPVFENHKFPDRILSATVTNDERYLIIEEAESTYGNQIYLKNLEQVTNPFICISETFDSENHIVGNIGNNFFLLTNKNASRYKLQVFTFSPSGKSEKKDLIQESKSILQMVYLAGNNLIAKYLTDAHAELKIFDIRGKFINQIRFDLPGDVTELNGEFGDQEFFYSYTSYTLPPEVYRYDATSEISTLLFKPELDYNATDYITDLKFCKSKDGTEIPLYISHKKGIVNDGNNPLLLYGYGGFNISLLPRFYPYLILWLENGGIFVNANIRGGGEYGEEWHKAGTKLNKQNVFDDFIAAAEYLIKEKYTNSEKLAVEGRSNGGLLIGTVVNQRPDLFKVALPAVGVMDMLRFRDFTIGWAWESDYGSVKNKTEYENLLSYSPLHNISSKKEYPAILVTTADRDDRVVPAHSFKYISTLQEKTHGKNPAFIRIQTDAGHGAGKPVTFQIEERADILAFIYYNMKLKPEIK